MALSPYTARSSMSLTTVGKTEFDILKSSHKFLRDDDGADETGLSWDDRLAQKYYDSLYREFAVCDLKHYKSGHFALRWRTEAEVLSGAGETTCGNTRCTHRHPLPHSTSTGRPALATLELPFAYVERTVQKSALVKVVLCVRCRKKLLWKRQKDKEEKEESKKEGEREDEIDMAGIRKRTVTVQKISKGKLLPDGSHSGMEENKMDSDMDLVKTEGRLKRGTHGGHRDGQRERAWERSDRRRRVRSSRSCSPPRREPESQLRPSATRGSTTLGSFHGVFLVT